MIDSQAFTRQMIRFRGSQISSSSQFIYSEGTPSFSREQKDHSSISIFLAVIQCSSQDTLTGIDEAHKEPCHKGEEPEERTKEGTSEVIIRIIKNFFIKTQDSTFDQGNKEKKYLKIINKKPGSVKYNRHVKI